MADFKKAFELMMGNEGGYVNDPKDPGGETYKGISRNNFPGWIGWEAIDLFKMHRGFPNMLDGNHNLQVEVGYFYETKFWNRIAGGLITEQDVANSIFDFGVNSGVATSARLAQKVVNAKTDGIIGVHTADALNSFNPAHFLAAFAVEKIRRYVEIIQARPESRKYLLGWIIRALK